jgi:amino-acid N-acetyltransferase
MSATVRIERATIDDGPRIAALLRKSALPVDGLFDHLDTAFVARSDGRIVGSAAIELYDDGALLRSVVVDDAFRGRGIGQRLTAAAVELADALNAPAVFLLTTTGEEFFPRFGFRRITREDVPQGVQTSIEFRSTCPASATVMLRALSTPAASRVSTSA